MKRSLTATHNSEAVSPSTAKSPSDTCPCCKGPHKFVVALRFCEQLKNKRSPVLEITLLLIVVQLVNAYTQLHKSGTTAPVPARTDYSPVNPVPPRELSAGNASSSSTPSTSASIALHNSCCSDPPESVSILGTAQARIEDIYGQWHFCRLVVDSGSQTNFMTATLADRLSLSRRDCSHIVTGVGNSALDTTLGQVHCNLASALSANTPLEFDAIVVPKIVNELPSCNLPSSLYEKFTQLPLADPSFTFPGPVDILLGVQAFLYVLAPNTQIMKGEPTAINTTLGWIILGSIPPSRMARNRGILNSLLCTQCEDSLQKSLRSFWEVEEILSLQPLSPNDEYCETYFAQTVSRDATGRYCVHLPFVHGSRPSLGSTRSRAYQRLLQLEKRFDKDPGFQRLYNENLQDYVAQGHMVPASIASDYLLTHHGVVKGEGPNRKVRVVFSPAENDSEGRSLNKSLLSGPKLQSDIGKIINQFRSHRVGITCDIKQMYRAIALHEEDCLYQHFLWRLNPSEPVQEWELRTVTFGVSSSPFLALRTVKQLVTDEGQYFPKAAHALLHGSYMDGILGGAPSIQEARELCDELVSLCRAGGFELGKWSSSSTEICQDFHSELKELSGLEDSSAVKVLGLWWDPKEDIFRYTISSTTYVPTKRGILSLVAKIYDINGYLAPLIFAVKVLLQQLWLLKIDWDETPPSDFQSEFSSIVQELHLVEKLTVPRYFLAPNLQSMQLIGFADASILGMAAVLYLRIETSSDVRINLIRSKTRVAPLKTWTILRLELGAATLLAKLVHNTLPLETSLQISEVICFSDSTTALGWIRTPPYRLKTFVANRVQQIHSECPQAIWRHVPGDQNPADPASRGLSPSHPLHCDLWWHGPELLRKERESWPVKEVTSKCSLPDLKDQTIVSFVSRQCDSNFAMHILERVSSLTKAEGIFHYVFRFCYNVKARQTGLDPISGPVTPSDYREALLFFVEATQNHYYSEEIDALKKGQPPTSAKLRPLAPFISTQGFLMVGGRLRCSSLNEKQKHPYIIPRESSLARLICHHFHLYLGHGGPNLVLSLIRREFLIPGARSLIRHCIFKCLPCYRLTAKPRQPVMADLPATRVNPSRCFTHTGVDFGGPFYIRFSTRRNAKTEKFYLALFVCFATKALHLEPVSALTTDACLAAIDRFIARRGLPSHIYSDQGRNFRGAAREISEIYNLLKEAKNDFISYLAPREIKWVFNPPYAPNFGGIFEAGIKSVKSHLKRLIGDQVLTLEEFYTVLSRIEAILNSRPLSPLSSSPNDDTDYLTPGHFLIGAPLLARPEDDLSSTPANRVSRWQLVQQITQQFWKKWHRDYPK